MPKLSKRDKRAKVTMTEARRRKEVALAKLREHEVKLREGSVVSVPEINAAVSAMIIHARDALLRIGPEICDRLAACTDPVACGEMVTEEITKALRGLSEYRPKSKPLHSAVRG